MTFNVRNWWNTTARYSKARTLGVRGRRWGELSDDEKEKIHYYATTGKVKI